MNKKLYAEDWLYIRNQIIARDKRKCVKCGINDFGFAIITAPFIWQQVTKEEYSIAKLKGLRVTRVYLQVAHSDNDKSNNDYSNLKSLCSPCHLRQDFQWKLLKRLSKGDI